MPIYCTSFLAVEEDKQQKIARVSICFFFDCDFCFRLVLCKLTKAGARRSLRFFWSDCLHKVYYGRCSSSHLKEDLKVPRLYLRVTVMMTAPESLVIQK